MNNSIRFIPNPAVAPLSEQLSTGTKSAKGGFVSIVLAFIVLAALFVLLTKNDSQKENDKFLFI